MTAQKVSAPGHFAQASQLAQAGRATYGTQGPTGTDGTTATGTTTEATHKHHHHKGGMTDAMQQGLQQLCQAGVTGDPTTGGSTVTLLPTTDATATA